VPFKHHLRIALPPMGIFADARLMRNEALNEAPGNKWLIRIPQVFAGLEEEILGQLEARCLRHLGRDFLLVEFAGPERLHGSAAAMFVPWKLPVHHSWPCKPLENPGFIEKAAQALVRKFGEAQPQTLMVGALAPDESKRRFRTLASNLRGRALQLFPPRMAAIRDAEQQDSRLPSLFCLLGEEGLFCGLATPLDANGFHPGGIRFIKQGAPGSISRAGGKIAGALHHLRLHQAPPASGAHWLELGASPGGMTAELLDRGYRVTAVDRAAPDPRLLDRARGPGGSMLHFIHGDAATCRIDGRFDALLCDMNGDARVAMRSVCRHAPSLRPGALVVFTLKLPDADGLASIQSLADEVKSSAGEAGLHLLSITHLPYNRREFTMLLVAEK
jgi:23S rRNA C2498 (ribose-2'-O)-methylase RlmM